MTVEFEIEGVFHAPKYGFSIRARQIGDGVSSTITPGSELGGVPVSAWQELCVDKDGKKLNNIFGFLVAKTVKKVDLKPGQLVNLVIPD